MIVESHRKFRKMTLTKVKDLQLHPDENVITCLPASVQKKQVVTGFPLAFQKYKIVDTHINMEEGKEETEHTMKMIRKLTYFITGGLEITCRLKDNHKNIT